MKGNKSDLKVVIMAGGSGKRLWPLSTESIPKQFVTLPEINKTLLELSFERCRMITDIKSIFVVALENSRKDILKILKDLPEENFIGEPMRKNTGPAISYATYTLHKKFGNSKLLFMSSDHIIEKDEQFARAVKKAAGFLDAIEGVITFGVKPRSPETGYGYIQIDSSVLVDKKAGIFKAKAFIEKPDKKQAQYMYRSGEFFWNMGIFLFRSSFFIEALEKYSPELSTPLKDFFTSENRDVYAYYASFPNISIDYALMEKIPYIYAAIPRVWWIDLGSWESMFQYLKKIKKTDKIVIGENVFIKDSKNVFVYNDTSQRVVISDVKNSVVVITNNGILIWPLKKSQELKNTITVLKY